MGLGDHGEDGCSKQARQGESGPELKPSPFHRSQGVCNLETASFPGADEGPLWVLICHSWSSLGEKCLRGDIIEVYEIMHGVEKMDMENFCDFSNYTITRGPFNEITQ